MCNYTPDMYDQWRHHDREFLRNGGDDRPSRAEEDYDESFTRHEVD